MSEQKFISYLRVSTERQGRSGLGLDAQRQTVLEYINGGCSTLIAEFIEVESGRRVDRPELAKALASCRIHAATLVVAKLDRLARNAHFLLGLKEAGVDFVCCDLPTANRLTVGILAVVAEEEARLISERTRAALAAARVRGVRLGHPNLTLPARRKGSLSSAAVRARKANLRARDLKPLIDQLSNQGCHQISELALALNARGVPASRGGRWSATQVARLVDRLRSAVTDSR